ncbi:MAG: right-handed parallel beta-helix repeat-containing protein [Haliscomenobacter sp.]|uniref:right-handed parallel beta-helix repeat-containing protein n=1 Tax=Haliscomenobacter sp. TaxID=2717303 RepID=UPI0029BCCBB7|nr:right-handed parallel beta-helix repeat-containing protein [Haliscomenobacter sp.]MDX2071896.1 right-handed parallel beta-helix repeat-containing protein [Haliscomenobacter sp.]
MKRILIFLFFALPLALSAATFYVATTGNDNNAGTLTAPFKTLSKAIAAASPGSIIELRGGKYTSSEIRINKSNLTIRSYANEWAIITAVTNVEDISSCLWYNEPEIDGGTLERLEIVGGYYYGLKFESNWDWDNSVPFSKRRGTSNITVRNCIIHDTGRDAIKLTPACKGIKILNCEIYNSGKGPGAQLDFNAEGIDNVNAPDMLVKGCKIHDIATTGVYAKGGARNCRIEGNTITNCGEGGIYLGFYTDAEWFDTQSNPEYFENLDGIVINNLIMHTKHAGIGLWGAKNAQIYHNTVVNAGQDEMATLFFNVGDVWLSDTKSAHPGNINAKIQNNLFVQTSTQNLPICRVRDNAGSKTNLVDNNIYFRNGGKLVFINDNITWEDLTLVQWKTQNGTDQKSLELDPKIDAKGHLVTGSPCIGKAIPIPMITHDVDGGLRDNSPDIGADEFAIASGIKSKPNETGLQLQIKQNPIQDETLQVSIQTEQKIQATFHVLSTGGQVLKSKTTQFLSGETTQQWSLTDLPAGIYVLRAMGKSSLFVKP